MRSRVVGIELALLVFLSLVASSGCARSKMLAAVFINHANLAEVDMLHLVESPPGHLTGSLVVSSLNGNGSRKSDAIYDLTGTITDSNVSLQLQGGLVGLAKFFGASTSLVGSLRGGTLTLSVGNQTEIFSESSQKQYGDALANLDKTGRHVAMVERAKTDVQQLESNQRRLNADLKRYIAWGEQGVNHVSGVRQWYADRIARYTKCLETIRPLAARGVESWRWQDCVLSIQTDEFDRDQEKESIQNAQEQNRDRIADLDKRINAAQQQFPRVLDEIKLACPYANNIEVCEKAVQKLKALPSGGFLDSALVASYKSTVPQVNAAFSADVQVATAGQNSLLSLAQQVDKIYQSAR